MKDISVPYSTMKKALAASNGSAQIAYWDTGQGDVYILKLVLDDFELTSTIVPEDTQNVLDFKTNVLPSSIAASSVEDATVLSSLASKPPVAPRAPDGRLAVRTTVANKTASFRLRAICFYTSDPSKLHSRDSRTLRSYGDVTQKMIDASGQPTDDPALCVLDVIDFEPAYGYEIDGGEVHIPSSLVDGQTDQWFMGCVGLPDFTAIGKSIDHISMVNIEAATIKSVTSDGRATVFLPKTDLPTNKFRLVIEHPAGASKRFQVLFRTFA